MSQFLQISLYPKDLKGEIYTFTMKSAADEKDGRESHWFYLVKVFYILVIVGGLWLLISTAEDARHPYFYLGLLLFMLGSFWAGYDKGHHVGVFRGYERGLRVQHKNEDEGM